MIRLAMLPSSGLCNDAIAILLLLPIRAPLAAAGFPDF
jgi:hypothetical protein